MKRQLFNDNWTFAVGSGDMLSALRGGGPAAVAVTLPHDAMILEKPTPDTKNGSKSGFYPGNNYTYTKKFQVPMEWKNKNVVFEFEGVYMNAFVYINGDYAANSPFGYSNFYVNADDFLIYGQENEIRVSVKNGAEANSRWYSGAGIYRDVKIIVGEKLHIKLDGVKITTPDIDADTAAVVVSTEVENRGCSRHKITVQTELRDPSGMLVGSDLAPLTMYDGNTTILRQRIAVSAPALWDCDHPNLYTCTVKIREDGQVIDETEETFGIRRLQLDVKNGLRINGTVVNLRGACIHHDNGVIGSVTLKRAEQRRCQQLKAAGFNCIRSAHHPMSKTMLDICDREGMLVMDELTDIWHNPKTPFDYSLYFEEWWERDTEALVKKDFNHPCVIIYSTGNEIQEAGTAKGAQVNRQIADKIKSLDDTRYTTIAVNALLSILDSVQEIVGDVLQELGMTMPTQAKEDTAGDSEGVDAVNDMFSIFSGPVGDGVQNHRIIGERVDETFAGVDISGMNYMTARHEKDHELYPNRIILGSETFPAEIVRLWDLVEKNPHVIGDMTWTGYDYLGEAGCGIFYYDGKANFSSNWPDRAAYIGDIDLIGNRRPISYLREIVFGLRKEPYIAVQKVNRYGVKINKTPWMHTDNIASWTWPGYEGKPAVVDVFSPSQEVELLLDGKSLGKKPAGKASGFIASYEMTYAPGTLVAVGYTGGKEDGRMELATAKEQVELKVEADCSELQADCASLSYVMISLADENGLVNRFAKKSVSVCVTGAGTLQGFGSADPQPLAGYDETTQDTFEGYVLAVIRAGSKPGTITVQVSADGCEEKTLTITTV